MAKLLIMDPRRNPYAPGAGTRPPELAGRDVVIDRIEIALDRRRVAVAGSANARVEALEQQEAAE